VVQKSKDIIALLFTDFRIVHTTSAAARLDDVNKNNRKIFRHNRKIFQKAYYFFRNFLKNIA